MIKNKIEKLRSQIDDLRYRYHVLNDPEVTDAMYDGLMDELRHIELANPELITPDSPTQRVAGTVADGFKKIVHQVPQWSFHDAFNYEDLQAWADRACKVLAKEYDVVPQDLTFAIEPKLMDYILCLPTKKESW